MKKDCHRPNCESSKQFYDSGDDDCGPTPDECDKELEDIKKIARKAIRDIKKKRPYVYCQEYAQEIEKAIKKQKFKCYKARKDQGSWTPFGPEDNDKMDHEFVGIYDENGKLIMYIDPWMPGGSKNWPGPCKTFTY